MKKIFAPIIIFLFLTSCDNTKTIKAKIDGIPQPIFVEGKESSALLLKAGDTILVSQERDDTGSVKGWKLSELLLLNDTVTTEHSTNNGNKTTLYKHVRVVSVGK